MFSDLVVIMHLSRGSVNVYGIPGGGGGGAPNRKGGGGGGGGGGAPHMKVVGMLVVSLRGVDFEFWSHLGCSGQNAILISREGLV